LSGYFFISFDKHCVFKNADWLQSGHMSDADFSMFFETKRDKSKYLICH